MKHFLVVSLAVVLPACLVCGEMHGEDQPHAQYAAGSTVNELAASGGPTSNVSAQHVTVVDGGAQRRITVDSGTQSTASLRGVLWDYNPATLNLEWLAPSEHLVVQTSELAPSVNPIQSVVLPPTGADPFFQRRPRPVRLEVLTPKRVSFWYSSFQKFRPRIA